ncbi:hypothetical protein HSX11_16445 [Oxalobacteraceae bacterium]|nr:hypothetical protein [Oxalobacteraceae bacterium]
MNKLYTQSFSELLGDLFHALGRTARLLMHGLQRASWPALLAVSLVAAVMLTIVPLALMLFLALLLVKLVIGVFFLARRRARQQRRHLP